MPLTRKIGLLPEETIAQISKLSTDQLDDLAEALLDFTRLDDLTQWLAIDHSCSSFSRGHGFTRTCPWSTIPYHDHDRVAFPFADPALGASREPVAHCAPDFLGHSSSAPAPAHPSAQSIAAARHSRPKPESIAHHPAQ